MQTTWSVPTRFAEVLQNIYHNQLLGGRWRESAAKKL
jgi:hypothetical protein